jgi:hypothetical protein
MSLDRPICPMCGMAMIAVEGFDQEPEAKTFECLRCGTVEDPKKIVDAA